MNPKYRVCAIADENCDSLNPDSVILETNNLAAAKAAAASASYPFGAGIEDTETGEIDVGFGFGVPCPDLPVDDQDEDTGEYIERIVGYEAAPIDPMDDIDLEKSWGENVESIMTIVRMCDRK